MEITIKATNPDTGGILFEGHFGHWQDCFFSFPPELDTAQRIAQILWFCDKENWTCDIKLQYSPTSTRQMVDCLYGAEQVDRGDPG